MPAVVEEVGVGVLLAGFAYAAVTDLRVREVSDHLWQLLGVVGLVVGAIAIEPTGLVPLLLWLLVAAFTLQHVFPWDDRLGDRGASVAGGLEILAYVGTLAVVAVVGARYGVGPAGLPLVVVAVLASVLLARALFELGALFGGADAKAVMIAALVVPLLPDPWLPIPPTATHLLAFLPFAMNLLTNAALFSLAVPIAVAVRNLRRGEFEMGRGFTGYSLPVSELPQRFVWIDDPAWKRSREDDDAETTAEDERRRTEAARELAARGIRRVWVTPQIPFVVLLALGALAATLAGNLLLDLIVAA
jgi:archaeal preflagellin peptidase FlaK